MVEHYKLVRVAEDAGTWLQTQAFLDCNLCGQTIDTVNGPASDTICVKCVELIKSGKLKGTVKRYHGWGIGPEFNITEQEYITKFEDYDLEGTKSELIKSKKEIKEYYNKLEASLQTNSALSADNADYKARLKAALSVIDPEFRKQMSETYHNISNMLQQIRTRGLE